MDCFNELIKIWYPPEVSLEIYKTARYQKFLQVLRDKNIHGTRRNHWINNYLEHPENVSKIMGIDKED